MRQRRRLAEQIVAFVEENWKRRVTVKEVGARFKTDPSDADRLFRGIMGTTIFCWQDGKRFEYVFSSVREDARYAYELAQELGYAEVHSFTRWIKKMTGLSWTEFCERVRTGSAPPQLKRRSQTKRPGQRPPKIDTQR